VSSAKTGCLHFNENGLKLIAVRPLGVNWGIVGQAGDEVD